MTSERSKRRDFLELVFISKSISKKLLISLFVKIRKNIISAISALKLLRNRKNSNVTI